jgi:UvrD-like helicase family protein
VVCSGRLATPFYHGGSLSHLPIRVLSPALHRTSVLDPCEIEAERKFLDISERKFPRLRTRSEAQDLCALQHALIEALAAPDGAATLAGDDDQAVYGWRGADLTRLHAFERTYPRRHGAGRRPVINRSEFLEPPCRNRAPRST